MDPIYKKIDVVGTSESSVTEAISAAIARASETVHNISWFEVDEIRGAVKDGKVAQYQVTLKIGFRLDGQDA